MYMYKKKFSKTILPHFPPYYLFLIQINTAFLLTRQQRPKSCVAKEMAQLRPLPAQSL